MEGDFRPSLRLSPFFFLHRLLEYSHAEQDKFKPQPTDLPTMHIAVTVDSIDEALLRMEKHGFKARGTPTLVQGRRIMYTEGADGE